MMRRALMLALLALVLLAGGQAAAEPPPWAHAKPKPTTTLPPTTTAATTTTVETTTTTVETTTTTTEPPANQLRWPPPADYLTYPVFHVGGAANVVNAGTSDARVVCDSPLTKGLRINGGRNVVMVGCEINITDSALPDTERNAVLVANGSDPVGGILHFEGIWAHGSALDDGITGDAPNSHWTVQRVLISELYGTDAGNHADCIQPWWGFQSFKMDRFTCYSQYQGTMLKAEDSIAQPGSGEWRETIYGRVNLKHYLPLPPGPGWLINYVPGTRPDGHKYVTGPIHFGTELFIAPRGNLLANDIGAWSGGNVTGQYFSFTGDTSSSGTDGTATFKQPNPDSLVTDGVIKEGATDYEPAGGCAGCPGLAYVGP